MSQQQSFGYWLKRRRKALDLTQAELASQVGCSAAAIRKMEAEERRPSAQIVERLADIFHVPPDERSTFRRFARGDWGSAPGEIVEQVPWRTSTEAPHSNLPATVTSFIGRARDVALVCEYLSREETRLVTLIGPPGIGKTRLGIESARAALSDFPDGVFFVALAPLNDPASIAPAIVQALGYVEAKNLSASRQLEAGIGNKQLLLVLDNCEHLVEDVASLVSGLLSACSRLKILVTSRESLRVPGEWLYTVPALDFPTGSSALDMGTASAFPALTLFAERARAVRSDFTLNAENLQAVASICAQLDGLPLAIELIAARIRLMSPQTLAERLSDQWVLSANGVRAVSARQKTLQNALGWSYDLLSSEEQDLFARLSVFTGGFTLDAAEAIFSQTVTKKSVSDLTVSLLDKSLLQRTYDTRGEPRFQMLVTIQKFARDRFQRNRVEAESRNWHLAYFLDLAEQADREMRGPDQVEWISRVESDYDNFRTALEWCVSSRQTEAALRLLTALGWPWNVRGHYREARKWFEAIRLLPGITDHSLHYARLLNHIAGHSWILGDFRDAELLLEDSQAILTRPGMEGERDLAVTLDWRGMVARWSRGDNQAAQDFFERSLELFQRQGELRGIAESLFHLGIVARDRNEDAVALSLFEQSFDLFHRLGDLWGVARVSQLLGERFLDLGDFENARIYFEQHLKIDESLQFAEGLQVALRNLGNLYRHRADNDQAEWFFKKSLKVCQEHGLRDDLRNILYYLGLLALQRNDYSLAQRYFAEGADLIRALDDKISIGDFLIGMAALASGTQRFEHAATLYGAAQGIFDTIDHHPSPFDRAELERHLQIARDQLGAAAFETLAAAGRALTLEQAIELALREMT